MSAYERTLAQVQHGVLDCWTDAADALIVPCPDCGKRVHAAELRDHRADKHGHMEAKA